MKIKRKSWAFRIANSLGFLPKYWHPTLMEFVLALTVSLLIWAVALISLGKLAVAMVYFWYQSAGFLFGHPTQYPHLGRQWNDMYEAGQVMTWVTALMGTLLFCLWVVLKVCKRTEALEWPGFKLFNRLSKFNPTVEIMDGDEKG